MYFPALKHVLFYKKKSRYECPRAISFVRLLVKYGKDVNTQTKATSKQNCVISKEQFIIIKCNKKKNNRQKKISNKRKVTSNKHKVKSNN